MFSHLFISASFSLIVAISLFEFLNLFFLVCVSLLPSCLSFCPVLSHFLFLNSCWAGLLTHSASISAFFLLASLFAFWISWLQTVPHHLGTRSTCVSEGCSWHKEGRGQEWVLSWDKAMRALGSHGNLGVEKGRERGLGFATFYCCNCWQACCHLN